MGPRRKTPRHMWPCAVADMEGELGISLTELLQGKMHKHNEKRVCASDALRQLLCATIKMISTALLSHCEVIDRGSFCLPISICIAFVTGKPIQSTSSGSAICSVRLCDQRLSPKTLIYIQS
uniref:Uncharacterized protein n=1 Tax=Physcomitrium patens TaxID=3218 RepID=A0A2K1JZU7_PHYPA|nr:hypothetical protein PHYPA_014171 [Physcomitrium patens]